MPKIRKSRTPNIRKSKNLRRFMRVIIPTQWPDGYFTDDKHITAMLTASPDYKRVCDAYFAAAGDMTYAEAQKVFGAELIGQLQHDRYLEVRWGTHPRIIIHWLDLILNRCATAALMHTDPGLIQMYGLKPIKRRKVKNRRKTDEVSTDNRQAFDEVSTHFRRTFDELSTRNRSTDTHAMTEKLHTNTNPKNNTNHNPKYKPNAPDAKAHPNPLMAASGEDLKSRATDAGFNTLFQKILPCFNVRDPNALKREMRLICASPAFEKARHPKNYMIKALVNAGFVPQKHLSDSERLKKQNNI